MAARFGERTEEIIVGGVSPNFFGVLRVTPAMGRSFAPGADTEAVVVISHEFWRSRFAASPNVVGRTVALNGSPVTIIGVAPPGFTGLVRGEPVDLWAPFTVTSQEWLQHPG
jgi:hypothetical protein